MATSTSPVGPTIALPSVLECFLARFSSRPCEGELRHVHLIEKQALCRRGHDPWDPRSYVLACGGPWPGLSGHHGLFDSYRLVVPPEALPASLVELAEEKGMVPYLQRRYGWSNETESV